MSVNDLRKYKNQYITQKKMPGPDVQQLPGGGGLTSYSFCTSPLYFAWAYLSYLMPSHFIVILSLSPCILFIVLGVPPPRQETRIIDYMSLFINYILYTFYTYIYIYVLGALGFRRVSWFSLIHMSKIIVSPQRNVDFAHSSFSFFNDNVTELNF